MPDDDRPADDGSATSHRGPDDRGPSGPSGNLAPVALGLGLTGQADITVGDEAATVQLDDCAMTDGADGGVLARGEGPGGRFVVSRTEGFGAVVFDVEVEDGPEGTYTGTVNGMSSQGNPGGLIRDRRRFELEGELRELYGGETIAVSLTVTCS